mgnify:CR=1 FL=1
MAASIDLDRLPDGMHVLSSMSCRKMGGPKVMGFSDFGEEIIILTSTGEIGQYHPNEVTSSFRSIMNLNLVEEKPHYINKEITHPKTYHVATLFSAFISIFWMIMVFSLLMDLAFNIDDFLSSTGSMSSEEVDSDFVIDSAVFAIFYIFFIPVLFFPAFITNFIERWAVQESLTITTATGSHVFYGVFPQELRLRLFRKSFWFMTLGIVPFLMKPDFLALVFVFYGILGLILLGFWMANKLFNDDEIDDYRGTQSLASMNRFHEAIMKIHKPSSIENTEFNLITVEDNLGLKIIDLKDRLATHEIILDKLTEKEWPLVFKAQTEYMGMTQIRRCTERILLPKVKGLGINLKQKNRGLSAIKVALAQNNAIDGEALTDLEIIITTTHPTAHGFSRSQEKYMTAFRSFVNIVEWSFDTSEEE